jgi:hypothetical protein
MEVRTYRGLVLWGRFEPVARADFRHVRRVVGSRLPEEYRRFIEVANGGTLNYSVDLPPGGASEPITFSALYTITANSAGDFSGGTVIGEWRPAGSGYVAPGFPADALPIARDGSGSELFLRLHPDHFGAVYAFAHGLPEWAGGDGRDTGGQVSASFDAFLDLLYIDDELAELTWLDAHDQAEWRLVVEQWLDSGLPGWRQRPWAAAPPGGNSPPSRDD